MTDLLVALVVLPIAAAAIPQLVGWLREESGWLIALVAFTLQTGLSLWLVSLVAARGRVTTTVGGFDSRFGIVLVADGLSAPFVVLVSAVSFSLLVYTRREGPHSNTFYSLYQLLVAGLTGVCLTGDAFNLYVFLEISGLAAYALVASGSGGRAAIAAMQYLFLGTIGATLYLLGVGYAYAATGTLNMAALAERLPHESSLTLAAFALIVTGLSVKLALFPLHTWQPAAYDHAPPAVSALLAALVSTVAGYALIRLVFGVFTLGLFAAVPLLDEAILLLAGGSVLAGGILAYRQTSAKRTFAYSSVAQFGLAALGIGLGNVPAVVGSVLQLLGHAVMKGGLFATAGVISSATGAELLDEYDGLGSSLPWESGALSVLGLGMVGIPPTVGFVAKWYLAVGAIEAAAWPVLALVLCSTLLSLTYFGRIVQSLYVSTAEPRAVERWPSAGMRGLAVGAAVVTVVLGLAAIGIVSMVEPAVTELMRP
ncbi:proton-conducting transporter transmembrane domain-containing protein [Haloarchaeobius sp. TZWWS8]|uniref:proton-conducting transporter transmembrane domain-containing protein n=1 Tax=Haloarchaeobius sp. TZWWS8 TaxID=3446121 RepID=UPI003EB7558C